MKVANHGLKLASKSVRKELIKVAHSLGWEVRRRHRTLDLTKDRELYEATYPQSAVVERRFYNVGAGSFRHPCWTNIDKVSDWYASQQQQDAVIDFDLMAGNPLPLPDGQAEVFYTSHTIEHIDDASARALFAEAERCLRAGGLFRIVCPNVDLAYRAWKRRDRAYFYWAERYSQPGEMARIKLSVPMNKASLEQLFIHHFVANASEIHSDGAPSRLSDAEVQRLFDTLPYEEAFDACVAHGSLEKQRLYPGNHINWWNPLKVMRFLQEAGFSTVEQSAYGQSSSPAMRDTRLFDATHPKMSLYVEATK